MESLTEQLPSDPLSDSRFIEIRGEGESVYLHREFVPVFEAAGLNTFDSWMALEGVPYREVSMRPHRPVVAFRLEGMTRDLYLKRNLDSPRPEGLLQKIGLALVESEARKEVGKIFGFHDAGIPAQRVIAWGEGNFGGVAASFIATEDLEALPLERYLFRNWGPPLTPEAAEDKREAIIALAKLTRCMHDAGWVHRDFYLGHLFVREGDPDWSTRLSVIDVQRATRRPRWWIRSRIKDLASLHFSADPAYIDDSDRTLFMKTYLGVDRFNPIHRFLLEWIRRKADRIRRHTEKALGIPYRDFFKNKYY